MKKILLITVLMSTFFIPRAFSLPALPDPTIPYAAMQYGDFYSYSLPLLNYWTDGEDKNNGTWSVPANMARDAVVVYTNNASVSDPNTNNSRLGVVTGFDDAYQAIDLGNSNDVTGSFYMTEATDPYGLAGDGVAGSSYYSSGGTDDYWDASVSALNSFLAGSELVFFFNNNEAQSTYTAPDGSVYPTDNLFGWGQVMLTDMNGISDTLFFDFTNVNTSNDVTQYENNFGAAPLGSYNDNIGYDAYQSRLDTGDFVLSGGDLCVNDTTGAVRVATAVSPCGTGETQLVHNNGANLYTYALYSPELNAALSSGIYETMSVDMRLDFLSNGAEELMILPMSVDRPYVIPEPSTLILLGCGLLGLAFCARRRKTD